MKTKEFLKSEDSNNGDAPWKPSYRWMVVTAGIIYIVLMSAFFILNIVLKPYMRELPLSTTPWLDKHKQEAKAQQQQPIKVEQDDQNGENRDAN